MNARSDSDNELLAQVATDVAVLTARYDATLPYLATKSDVLAVRDDVQTIQLNIEKTLNARLEKIQYWLIGTMVTCALGVGGVYQTMMVQLMSLSDAQQVQLRQEIRADREQLRQDMKSDREQLRQEMKADREQLRQEIAGLSNRIDRVLEANASASAQRRSK